MCRAVAAGAVMALAVAGCSGSPDDASAPQLLTSGALDTAPRTASIADNGGAGLGGSDAAGSGAVDATDADSRAPRTTTPTTDAPPTTSAPSVTPTPTTTPTSSSTLVTDDTTIVLPPGYTMTVATESGPSGPVTRTQVFSTTGGISLAPELVIDVTVDPKLDTTGIDVDGAIAAYKGLITTSDAGLTDPTKDWTNEVHKYAINPVAAAILSDIEKSASFGVHVVGHTKYAANVAESLPKAVSLIVCIDTRGQDIRDIETGQSVKAGKGWTIFANGNCDQER